MGREIGGGHCKAFPIVSPHGLVSREKKGNGQVSCSPWAGKWLIGDTFKSEASEASYASLEAGPSHFRDEWSFSACAFETGDDGCLSLINVRRKK